MPEWAKGVTLSNPLNNKKQGGELVFSDPAVWQFASDEEGKGFLELDYDRKNYKSTYTPKHRSPIHIALFRQMPLTDFVMDVEAMSTTEPYGHQDVCLFFEWARGSLARFFAERRAAGSCRPMPTPTVWPTSVSP